MAKNLGDAYVRVRPDTTGFQSEAKSSLAGGLKVLAGGVAAIFAAAKVKDFLVEATQGYRDHLKVAALTRQVIKTTGGAAKISAREVGALSDAIERKTGVDGDAIQSGANLLLTFTNVKNAAGKGNDVFNRSTALLADMSTALGQDAKGSAIQLGKALNDPIKGVSALSRVGVSFTEQQQKQIKTLVDSGNVLGAQKVILHELGKEFGGAAQAAATPADKARTAYHQLQDEVGKVTVPIMNKLALVFSNKIAPPLLALAERVLPKVRKALLGALKGVDFSALTDLGRINLSGVASGVGDTFKGINWGEVGAAIKSAGGSLKELGPALKSVSTDDVNNGISVFSTVIKFAADHTDLLAKALPVLVAGFVAYKAAQLASNTIGKNSTVGFVVATGATISLALANRSLAKATAQATAAQAVQTTASAADAAATTADTVATESNTGAQNAGILARIRQRVATIASTVASKAAAVASKVMAAGQWLLNAALTANPIGLVVVAIAALVAGLIIAYKKSDTFRKIVNAAFLVVKNVVASVVGWFGKYVPQVFGVVVSAVKAYINVYKTVIVTAFNIVRKTISVVMAAVKGVVSSVWGAITGIVSRGAALIVSAVKAIPGKITALAGAFKSAGHSLIQAMVDGLKNAAGIITGIAGNVWDAVRSLLNGAITKINAALEFSINKGPIHLTINPPDIPQFAKGGRVSRPTLLLAGEGREAESIIPDSLMVKALERAARSGGRGGGRFALTITNWREGTGFIREIAADEVSDATEFAGTLGRMGYAT